MNVHEEMFARSFIVSEKKDRYLSLLDSIKGRKKIVSGLDHCPDLDMRFATLIPTGSQSVDSVEKMLKRKGAPKICYIMSSNGRIDGQEMLLREALSETL